MKFSVCIKQVPDVNAPIQIKQGQLIQDADRMVLNAYDASAVEEALVLSEQVDGEVEVILVGPEKGSETIRKALAMGADSGIHIVKEANSSWDSAEYARILATYFKEHEFNIIFTGKQSQDTDSGLAGGMLAQHLSLPYTSNAVGMSFENDHLNVTRQGDTGQELLALKPPCLVTCSNDMNEPRIPTLKGIMQSRRKPVNTISLSNLGIEEAEINPKTEILKYEEKPERQPGEKFEGDAGEVAQKVAKLLDEEQNVIQ